MDSVRNTIAENFGGPASKLGTRQFELSECPDLSGKVGAITGGSRGIGYAVAYTFLKNNISKLYVISVSPDVMAAAKREIASELGDDVAARIEWKQCDLTNWPRVHKVAEEIKADTDRLDILVNNAGRGVMTAQLTDYGVDRHMALNHMGHMVLTSGLLPLMKKTADEGNVVRITHQSSNAHQNAPSDTKFASLEEINTDAGPNGQYGRSKLASILYTRYFARKNGHPNVLMNATHPGFVSTKQSVEDVFEPYPRAGYIMSHVVDPIKKDQWQGAVPTVYAATTTTESGEWVCPPAIPEPGNKLAQSEELQENLMALTGKIYREKMNPVSADKGQKFEDLVLT
ncbi:retinol dehydrogenase 12 [Coniochaeta ligniaria NRRL 30616]|uniref:Retinol dehydrogenase 12 n=1 Tax=Coniochaeta ligniaria NRRL 30616 TaxID=1408157 RepID=A0A1J7IK93_9PEZI|nr:retinol dehydrogenase 12 [Coniochaeta ligniaria NRRL 30616]